MFARRALMTVLIPLFSIACAEDEASGGVIEQTMDAGAELDSGAAAADAAPEADTGSAPGAGAGVCLYSNPFSRGDECKAYVGLGWAEAAAEADCAAVLPNTAGTYDPDGACAFEAELGQCDVGDMDDEGYQFVSAGSDAAQCDMARLGCETFSRGTFTAAGACATDDVCAEPGEPTGRAFQQPYVDCRDPLPGEPPGTGPDGQVCTPVIISGCTEPGRRFDDYASCEVVLSQRPYGGFSTDPGTDEDDPRLQDAAYLAEVAWVKREADACGCVCCHSDQSAPNGASGWTTDAGALWIDTVPDSGLAMMAGLVDSSSFGAVHAGDNNGFDRLTAGIPTTDVERMTRFLTQEYVRRGNTLEDAAELRAFGGPLAAQAVFEPTDCADQGVMADGTVIWTGGEARYVYVLEADAANPGTPPNLDEPEGTLWFIDVESTTRALGCGMTYGAVPERARQRVPAEGAPPALVPGEQYYLYVLRDIAVPVTRCLFTFEGDR
jgi:hypothetical protein